MDKNLCRITTQRMIDSGISLDLVCLSSPPLHSVPLFRFQSRNSQLHSMALDLSVTTNLATAFSQSQPRSDRSEGKSAYSVESRNHKYEMIDHLYLDDSVKEPGSLIDVFIIPDWIDCSFWERSRSISDHFGKTKAFVPRCKMFEVQMMGLIDNGEIDMPFLDISDDVEMGIVQKSSYEIYDDSVFLNPMYNRKFPARNRESSPDGRSIIFGTSEEGTATKRQPHQSYVVSMPKSVIFGSLSEKWAKDPSSNERTISMLNRNLSEKNIRMEDKDLEYSSPVEPIRIRNKSPKRKYEASSLSTDSRGPSPVPRNHFKFSPSKSQSKSQELLRHKYVNPFKLQKGSHLGANDRRWEHIYPKWISHDESKKFINWKSLCIPACLPLTIEYFPSSEELSAFYLEYTYTVSPAYDEPYNKGPDLDRRKIESLLIELISQRLAQGFQLIVAPTQESSKQATGIDYPKFCSKSERNFISA